MSKKNVYLDWNSTTPPLAAVVDAMRDALLTNWGNPASLHRTGRSARAALEDTREILAQLSGVEPRGVIFTSGGTEANNWALSGACPIVTSRLEHPSVTRFAEAAQAAGRSVSWLSVEPSGVVSLDALDDALARLSEPAIVSVMAANHETGVIQPIREVAERVHRHGSRLHVDAVQWIGKGPWEALADADSVTLAAHKLRGPKGIGALLLRSVPPPRLLHGGAQERGLRAGTQDAALAAGFGVALRHLDGAIARHRALAALRDRLEQELSTHGLVNGSGSRLPHVTNLSFEGFPGPELVAALDLIGISVSSGSACSAGTSEPSSVIRAMLGDARASSAVRVSLGEDTSAAEVEYTIQRLCSLLRRAHGER